MLPVLYNQPLILEPSHFCKSDYLASMTFKYNTKQRLGRGFSLEELKVCCCRRRSSLRCVPACQPASCCLLCDDCPTTHRV